MTDLPVISDIFAARKRITGVVRRTPLLRSDSLSRLIDGNVLLKLENQQVSGSFKPRGAANRILSLDDAARARGLLTISSGNHGRALAYLARQLGLRAVICLYEAVPEVKRQAIRDLGGEVLICGKTYSDAEAAVEKLRMEEGLTFVAPFDDPHVIAGQGTIGLEIAEDCPEADALIVPLSGGGLFSGVGLAASHCLPAARRIGIANAHGNGMTASLEAGKPVPIEEHESLADCMAGTISPDNRFSFRMCQALVDEAPLVPEDSIVPALRHAFFEEKLILEGGATLPIAYLTDHAARFQGQTVVLVLTGQNIDMGQLLTVVGPKYPS